MRQLVSAELRRVAIVVRRTALLCPAFGVFSIAVQCRELEVHPVALMLLTAPLCTVLPYATAALLSRLAKLADPEPAQSEP